MATMMALATLAAPHARGQATLEADTIALGDQTWLSGRFGQPSGDGIEVLGMAIDSATGTQRALITSFEPGDHWLQLGNGDSVLLVVTDVEIDTATAELRDIAPVERVPYTFWELFRWVLLVWAIAAVGIVAWWLVERRRKHGSILVHHEPVDTRTPIERANDELEALRRKQLWQSGKAKEYHTELTDTVRRFIEEVSGIRATELTSDETIAALSDNRLAMGTELLRDMFTTADLVKFAKSEPLPHEHEHSLTCATQYVDILWQATRPQTDDKEAEQ